MDKQVIILGAIKLMRAGEDKNIQNAITTAYICYVYDLRINNYLRLSQLEKIQFIRNAMRNSSIKKYDLIAYHLTKNEFAEYIHIVESGQTIWHAISKYSEIVLEQKKQAAYERAEHVKRMNAAYNKSRIGFKQVYVA